MLNGDAVVDAVVAALRTIDPLVSALGGDPQRISAAYRLYGTEVPLNKAVHEMQSGSVLVAWDGTMTGNFSGMVQIKHRIPIFIRARNQASELAQQSYAALWWSITNSPLSGTPRNIRQVQLLPELLLIDTPAAQMRTDEEGIDFLTSTLVIPEIGDN